ncbi:AraC family transcriptional regulator [Paenibacillus aurantius]|uniref:AraC family transcriptional regulator n=1 Tax=Paenibacillus aurantius TaxID=2918900 RepID=A0AA96RJ80_9BACL|nr:AraC family transcriptional regulator [Paenibacillus aurantius]WNQ12944.1 AraC family transcriptional regulator [Paenibacillus aurantius]
MLLLTESQMLDPRTGVHFAWHDTLLYLSGTPHTHEYFELFLMAEGRLLHRIQDKILPLAEGELVFIRPSDVHTYESAGDAPSRLVNLAFSRKMVADLFVYLGLDLAAHPLLTSPLPPSRRLDDVSRKKLIRRLELLTEIPSSRKEEIRLLARSLIAELLHQHFLRPEEPEDWFERLVGTMSEREHFVAGIPRLRELSPCSYEHVCRRFKKTFGCSPSEWINERRLAYAANLLRHTDRSVLETAGEAGFDNPAYFHTLFKARYGVTPLHYRKREKRLLIP